MNITIKEAVKENLTVAEYLQGGYSLEEVADADLIPQLLSKKPSMGLRKEKRTWLVHTCMTEIEAEIAKIKEEMAVELALKEEGFEYNKSRGFDQWEDNMIGLAQDKLIAKKNKKFIVIGYKKGNFRIIIKKLFLTNSKEANREMLTKELGVTDFQEFYHKLNNNLPIAYSKKGKAIYGIIKEQKDDLVLNLKEFNNQEKELETMKAKSKERKRMDKYVPFVKEEVTIYKQNKSFKVEPNYKKDSRTGELYIHSYSAKDLDTTITVNGELYTVIGEMNSDIVALKQGDIKKKYYFEQNEIDFIVSDDLKDRYPRDKEIMNS